ncbi:hypothetical protein PS2_024457 [Malus domestica]
MRPQSPRRRQRDHQTPGKSSRLPTTKKFTVKNYKEDAPPLSATSTTCTIPSVQPSSSVAELKAVFRAKVKQFQAYEMLLSYSQSEIIERH